MYRSERDFEKICRKILNSLHFICKPHQSIFDRSLHITSDFFAVVASAARRSFSLRRILSASNAGTATIKLQLHPDRRMSAGYEMVGQSQRCFPIESRYRVFRSHSRSFVGAFYDGLRSSLRWHCAGTFGGDWFGK